MSSQATAQELQDLRERLADYERYADHVEQHIIALQIAFGVTLVVALGLAILLYLRHRRMSEVIEPVDTSSALTLPEMVPVFLEEPATQLVRELVIAQARLRFWKNAYFGMLQEHRRLVSVNASIEDAFKRMAALGGIYLGGVVQDMSATTEADDPVATQQRRRHSEREEAERQRQRLVFMQHQGMLRLLIHFARTGGFNEDLSNGVVREGDVLFVCCSPRFPRGHLRAEIIRLAREGADCATRFRLDYHENSIMWIEPLSPGEPEKDPIAWAIRS